MSHLEEPEDMMPVFRLVIEVLHSDSDDKSDVESDDEVDNQALNELLTNNDLDY